MTSDHRHRHRRHLGARRRDRRHVGEIRASLRDTTPRTERETEDLLVNLITKLAATQPVSAVGLAVAGFVSADRQRVMFAPHLAWRDADVPERISARVQPAGGDGPRRELRGLGRVPARRSAGAPIALLIALGTGIGAGLIIDGEIYRGAHGVAPELGHLTVVPGGRPCPCGKQGCWERYCSGTALAQTARLQMADHDAPVLRQLSGDDPAAITGTMVAVAATEGDPAALAAMDELGRWLAAGLALVTDVLDPEVIVIGGGVAAPPGCSCRWRCPSSPSRSPAPGIGRCRGWSWPGSATGPASSARRCWRPRPPGPRPRWADSGSSGSDHRAVVPAVPAVAGAAAAPPDPGEQRHRPADDEQDRQDHRQVGGDGQDAWTGEQQDPADDHQHGPDRPQPGPGQRGRIRRGEVLGVGVTFGLLLGLALGEGRHLGGALQPAQLAASGPLGRVVRDPADVRVRRPAAGRSAGPSAAGGVGGVGRRAGSDLDGRRGP